FAVGVGVVAGPARGRDGRRGGVGGRVAVGGGDGGVVAHGQRDGGDVRVQLAVVRLVGERVRTGVAGAGRVGERAVRVQRHRAVSRAGGREGEEGGTLRVRVVAEHCRGGHVKCGA